MKSEVGSKKRQKWTPEKIELLKALYPDHYTSDVADRVGMKIKSCYVKANDLQIKKSEAFIKMELQKQAERLTVHGVKSRFKSGHTSHNKGKKMPEYVYRKAKATMFSPNHLPHNTKYDGHVRISKDGYREVRISRGLYRLEHLHRWEEINGKLPKGYCLRSIDGDKLNTEPSNWQLVSRADNMRLNSIQRYPPEVIEVIKLTAKLKKRIEKHEKQD
jgi:hypothetical protein